MTVPSDHIKFSDDGTGDETMTNQENCASLTLGEQAASILMMHRRKNPAMGGPSDIDKFWGDKLVREQWGLDPHMTVAELRRRLAIAERVLTCEADQADTFYGGDLLRWMLEGFEGR